MKTFLLFACVTLLFSCKKEIAKPVEVTSVKAIELKDGKEVYTSPTVRF